MAKPLAAQFHALFAGHDRAHGVYIPPKVPQGVGKAKGQQFAEPTPPTPDLWKAHLTGERGLGVYMLRPSGTVRFAAIDVDVYPLPHKLVVRRVHDANLPLVVCPSKSGGAHLYLFGREDLPASLVRRRLAGWAAKLNLYEFAKEKALIEIFPKADALNSDDDFGNYLNMPYFGSTRHAIGLDGKPLTPEQFLASRRVTVKELEALGLSEEEAFKDGPPCLQALISNGPISSFRDNSLLAMGVYVKHRFEETWETKLEEYHRQFIGDPLTAREVLKVQRSVEKKDYNYACKKAPLVSRCQKEVCITRAFGVRAVAEQHGQDVGFNLNLGQFKKFDMDGAPLYQLEVDGRWLQLSTDTLLSNMLFRKACFEQLNRLVPRLKGETWDEILGDLMSRLVIEQAPPDVGAAGQVRHTLEQYCRYLPAQRKEELKDGRAWAHNGVIWFRLPYFEEYLKGRKVMVTPKEIASMFKRWGFKHGQINMKGVCVQYWEMPDFPRQNEPDDVPRPAKQQTGGM